MRETHNQSERKVKERNAWRVNSEKEEDKGKRRRKERVEEREEREGKW